MSKFIIRILPFLFLLSVLVLGCFGSKKVQIRTVTETVIKIDTIIQIQTDTVTLIKSVRFTDTAYLENPTALAKSYYSTQKQRIVLELKGKTFDVPVTIYKKVQQITDNKTNEPVKKRMRFELYIFVAMVLLFGYAYLTRKR